MKKVSLLSCIIALSFLFGQKSFAQEDAQSLSLREREQLTRNHLEDLKNGLLVIVLKTHSAKYNALLKVINDPQTSENVKNRIQKEIDVLLEKNKETHEELTKAIVNEYSYSDFAFIYDSSLIHLRIPSESKVIFNEDGHYDAIDDRPLYFLMKSRLDPAYSTGSEAYIIHDHDMNPLPSPFPGSALTYILWIRRDLYRLIRKLNNKLNVSFGKFLQQ